jgi:hypothetical protein
MSTTTAKPTLRSLRIATLGSQPAHLGGRGDHHQSARHAALVIFTCTISITLSPRSSLTNQTCQMRAAEPEPVSQNRGTARNRLFNWVGPSVPISDAVIE